MSIRDVYIVDAVRTPIGKFGGALAAVRPDDLAAHVVRSLVDRTPELDPARIDDVYFGDANGAGEDNRDVARMAVLLAGLPVSVPGVTVNRLCGSGLEAVIQAARAIAVGDASIAVAGGVESMSRAPWVDPEARARLPRRPPADVLDHPRLAHDQPEMPAEWTVALGEGAELIADKHGITREQQDAFALDSHRKAAEAWAKGLLRRRGRPVRGRRPASATNASASPPPWRRSPGSSRPSARTVR